MQHCNQPCDDAYRFGSQSVNLDLLLPGSSMFPGSTDRMERGSAAGASTGFEFCHDKLTTFLQTLSGVVGGRLTYKHLERQKKGQLT